MMNVQTIPVGMLDTNCYIVSVGKNALVIDPGGEADKIVPGLRVNGLTSLKAIVCTHGHYDHIGAVAALKKKFNIPVYIHENEKEVLEGTFMMFGVERFTVDRWIKDGDEIQFTNDDLRLTNEKRSEIGDRKSTLKVLHTPGHTPGGICLYNDDVVFTGDTVFAEGYLGRTDLPGGSDREMSTSMLKVLQLPEKLIIYPGHGPKSTIGEERSLHNLTPHSPSPLGEGAKGVRA